MSLGHYSILRIHLEIYKKNDIEKFIKKNNDRKILIIISSWYRQRGQNRELRHYTHPLTSEIAHWYLHTVRGRHGRSTKNLYSGSRSCLTWKYTPNCCYV